MAGPTPAMWSFVSGYDFMWQYVATGAKRPVVVQLLRVQRRRIDPCGAPMVSGGADILEVFRQPANDTIMSALCCESWQADSIEGWVTIYEEASADREVRAALAAIQSGQNVVGLNTRVSPARFGQLARDVEARAQIRWRASYDYDGCDRNDPATRCNHTHCLSMSWTDSITSSTRSFTSP